MTAYIMMEGECAATITEEKTVSILALLQRGEKIFFADDRTKQMNQPKMVRQATLVDRYLHIADGGLYLFVEEFKQ